MTRYLWITDLTGAGFMAFAVVMAWPDPACALIGGFNIAVMLHWARDDFGLRGVAT